MKQFHIYTAGSSGNPKNCIYHIEATVNDEASFKQAVGYDHVCAKYRDDRRSNSAFLSSDCIMMDCDNTHSEDPAEWKTPEDNNRYPWTELGAGTLYADCYKDVVRYVPKRKCWFYYADGVWNMDTGGIRAMEYCKELAKEMMDYAFTISDEHKRQDFMKYCSRWQARKIASEENTFSFSYEGSTGSVNTVEYKQNNILLEKYQYTRTENVCTEQFSGNDSILNNEDDTVVTYTFDKNCRVISTEIKNIYGESFGSLAYGYKDKEIIDASYSGKQNINYVANSSFEHSGTWQFSSNENAVYTNAKSKYGANSLMLNNTGTAEQTVEVPFNLYNNVMVASAYVKSDSDSAVFVQADVILNGNVVQTFTGERAHNTEGEWEQITTPFFMPEEYDEIKISLVNTQNSTVYFDAISLEKSAYPEKYNLIENTHFDLVGNLNEENTAYQDIYLSNAKQTDTYILSGNATAHSLPTNENRKYALKAEVFYTGSDVTKTVCIDYSSYNNEEQYGQVGFNLATDNEALIPCRIRVTADYSYNYNSAVFDNIALIKTDNVIVSDESKESEEDSSYVYNDDGTISSYTDYEGNITRYLYTDGKLVSVETKNRSNEVTYRAEYNSNEDIVFELSEGLTTTYSYNDDKLSRVETKDLDNNVVSYSDYRADGNIVTDFSDNQTTSYTYYADGSLGSAITMNSSDVPVYGEIYSDTGYLTDYYSDGIYYRYTYDENGNVTSKAYGLLDYVDTENYDIVDAKIINYSYDNNRCTTVICNGFEYSYAYDDFNNANALSVNGNLLESKELYYNGLVRSRTYGNGDYTEYEYDLFGNLTDIYGTETGYSMLYDSLNNKRLTVNSDGIMSFYKYDDSGRCIGVNRLQYDENYVCTNELNRYRVYYADNSVSKTSVSSQNATVTNNYSYYTENNTSSSQFGNITFTSSYDEDGTLQSKTGAVNESFTNNDDTLIATHTIGNDTYSYEYSDKGNIISESKNNTVIRSYNYDSFGQLIRENNLDTNTTVLYNYDNGGNITSKVSYPYSTGDVGEETGTVNYTYDNDWTDKLTSFNGESISYDEIGNPVNYRGAVCTFSGRQLQSFTKNGTSISYKYDENGLRTSKTVNGIQHDYYYIDDVLMHEKVGDDYELFYRYDIDGNLVLITRINIADNTSEDFAVITNIQGDVIELIDSNSDVVATYTYDAWGNVTVTSTDNIATQNSIRYRGYVYDTETGLYYLQSRYYDPETGLFINCDCPDYIGANDSFNGWNAFAYCENDPVNFVDPYGKCYLNAKGQVSHDRWEYSKKYDYNAAIKYAENWWNKRNTQYYSYHTNGDCANFVSQCLYNGGFLMNETWYSFYAPNNKNLIQTSNKKWYKDNRIKSTRYYCVSDAWSKASELYNYLSGIYKSQTYKTSKSLQTDINNKSIKIGYVAFFKDKSGKVHHAVIIGKITSNDCFYYAHSTDRNAIKEAKRRINGFGFLKVLKKDTIIIVQIGEMK